MKIFEFSNKYRDNDRVIMLPCWASYSVIMADDGEEAIVGYVDFEKMAQAIKNASEVPVRLEHGGKDIGIVKEFVINDDKEGILSVNGEILCEDAMYAVCELNQDVDQEIIDKINNKQLELSIGFKYRARPLSMEESIAYASYHIQPYWTAENIEIYEIAVVEHGGASAVKQCYKSAKYKKDNNLFDNIQKVDNAECMSEDGKICLIDGRMIDKNSSLTATFSEVEELNKKEDKKEEKKENGEKKEEVTEQENKSEEKTEASENNTENTETTKTEESNSEEKQAENNQTEENQVATENNEASSTQEEVLQPETPEQVASDLANMDATKTEEVVQQEQQSLPTQNANDILEIKQQLSNLMSAVNLLAEKDKLERQARIGTATEAIKCLSNLGLPNWMSIRQQLLQTLNLTDNDIDDKIIFESKKTASFSEKKIEISNDNDVEDGIEYRQQSYQMWLENMSKSFK